MSPHRRGDRLGGRRVREEGANLHARLHRLQRAADVERYEREEPEGEKRKGDGGDAQGAEHRRAAKAQQRLTGGEPHGVNSGIRRFSSLES